MNREGLPLLEVTISSSRSSRTRPARRCKEPTRAIGSTGEVGPPRDPGGRLPLVQVRDRLHDTVTSRFEQFGATVARRRSAPMGRWAVHGAGWTPRWTPRLRGGSTVGF